MQEAFLSPCSFAEVSACRILGRLNAGSSQSDPLLSWPWADLPMHFVSLVEDLSTSHDHVTCILDRTGVKNCILLSWNALDKGQLLQQLNLFAVHHASHPGFFPSEEDFFSTLMWPSAPLPSSYILFFLCCCETVIKCVTLLRVLSGLLLIFFSFSGGNASCRTNSWEFFGRKDTAPCKNKWFYLLQLRSQLTG